MKNRKFFLANNFENWIFLRDMIFKNEKKNNRNEISGRQSDFHYLLVIKTE